MIRKSSGTSDWSTFGLNAFNNILILKPWKTSRLWRLYGFAAHLGIRTAMKKPREQIKNFTKVQMMTTFSRDLTFKNTKDLKYNFRLFGD